MMYYQPPVDCSAVQAERATTPRVIVEATAAEAVDIAVDEKWQPSNQALLHTKRQSLEVLAF